MDEQNELRDMSSPEVMAARSAARRGGQKQMITGLLLMILGIAITVVTYKLAASSESGGRYMVTWGLVLWGLVDFVRGMMTIRRS